ncbi:flavodoxin [Sedimentibacter sp.]|uniref:flavodoxin family protein n=1 Tax=Sedimentibacter sp. TaxID=1960295 RepID=UPI0028A5F234|nr:flavodoxin [Sedimentibacter sp.]
MRNLVVYYSRDGSTEVIAQEIARAVNGDLNKIELIKDTGYIRAGFAGSFGLYGKIKKYDFNAEDYDNIFIGTPVWGGKSSTPINTFIRDTDFTGKNVFVFVTQFDVKIPHKMYRCISRRVMSNHGRIIDYLFIQSGRKEILTSEQVVGPVTNWIKNLPISFDSMK